MASTKVVNKSSDEPKTGDDVKIVSTGGDDAATNLPPDGHSDFTQHDYTAGEPEGSKVKPDQPSNLPGGVTGNGEVPPKSSGAGVDPEVHTLDEATGITATGSDHPGPGMKSTPLPPGQTATLDNYTAESGAVASTPVKNDPRRYT